MHPAQTPLAKLVKSLAGLHQTEHHHMVSWGYQLQGAANGQAVHVIFIISTSVKLVLVVSGEDDLSPKAAIPVNLHEGDNLLPGQLADVTKLQTDFASLISLPCPVAQTSYSTISKWSLGLWRAADPIVYLNTRKKVVQEELKAIGIEESYSDWASPKVLVPKTDVSVCFCVDYRKVNAVSKFGTYPMPQVEKLAFIRNLI